TVVLGSVARTVDPAAKVYAIDPHDGLLGTNRHPVRGRAGSGERFTRNIAVAGLDDVVEPIVSYSHDICWERPISLLVVDHLHDAGAVAVYFSHFEAWLMEGGLVAFHDYADYYPGVKAFVDQLLASEGYEPVQRVQTMAVIRKAGGLSLPAIRPLIKRL